MKILLTILLALPCSSVAQPAKFPSELNWLIGTWNRLSSDSSVIGTETWKIGKEEFTGFATSIKNGDTIVTETLRLKISNGKLDYTADVKGNETSVSFSVTSHSGSEFICENPHHDFPKQIEYKLDGKSLMVTISDNNRKIDFNFVRRN